MTDLDALLSERTWEPNVCRAKQALGDIADEAAREKVAAAALNRNVPLDNVAKALTHLGARVPEENPLRRHRLGRCLCE